MRLGRNHLPKERRCKGLPPGAECPTHRDGTWPDGCQCWMWGVVGERRATALFMSRLMFVLTLLGVIALAFIATAVA